MTASLLQQITINIDLSYGFMLFFYFIDINECKELVALCRNGRCRNTEGSFTCECADGYTLTPDGEHCRDVNECTEVSNWNQ